MKISITADLTSQKILQSHSMKIFFTETHMLRNKKVPAPLCNFKSILEVHRGTKILPFFLVLVSTFEKCRKYLTLSGNVTCKKHKIALCFFKATNNRVIYHSIQSHCFPRIWKLVYLKVFLKGLRDVLFQSLLWTGEVLCFSSEIF